MGASLAHFEFTLVSLKDQFLDHSAMSFLPMTYQKLHMQENVAMVRVNRVTRVHSTTLIVPNVEEYVVSQMIVPLA